VVVAETLRVFGVLDVTRSCVSGISGLNFALKSYLSVVEPGDVSIWGFIVPGKFATAAELAVIHLLNPHAPSLVYHFVGVAVGVSFAAAERKDVLGKINRLVRLFARGNGGRARRAPRRTPEPPPGVREANAAAAAAAAAAAESRARASGGSGHRFFSGLRGRRPGGSANTQPPFGPSSNAQDSDRASRSARAIARLKPGTRVVLAGLRATDMNGSWGIVAGPDLKNLGRLRVTLDSGSEFSVLPEKCVVVDTTE
jgi:hypothetical protein